jgi:transposase
LDTTAPARRRGRRANFPLDFKRQVVEATLQPGASVSLIARKHDVNANLVFRWRHQYQEGAFGLVNQSATFLPVQVIEASTDVSQTAQTQFESHSELVVEVGKATLRIMGTPDSQTLQLVCSSYCDDCPSRGNPYLDRCGRYGHAPWLRRLGGAGADTAGSRPFLRSDFAFRGRRGDRIKLLWWDGDGLCLFCKRLEQGRFVWPQATSGSVSLTTAQLSMLLEGIDWRRPIRTAPVLAV